MTPVVEKLAGDFGEPRLKLQLVRDDLRASGIKQGIMMFVFRVITRG